MRFKRIVLLDDLLREEWWPAKEFFYDLMRTPIKIATGFDIKHSPRLKREHNLDPSFNPEFFKEICFNTGKKHWSYFYYDLPEKAENYLLRFISKDDLVISYEMPPYLKTIVTKADATYLDVRISPIRFLPDLLIALNTNDRDLEENIRKYSVSNEEIELEASLIKAKINHLYRYTKPLDDLSDCLIFIGQTDDDASLVDITGYKTIEDYVDKIREIIEIENVKNIFYKPHPNKTHTSLNREVKILSKITGQDVKICNENIYSLFSREERIIFIGISSSLLQEATFFGKKSYILFKPICDLNVYIQVRFPDFISPGFYCDLFNVRKKLNFSRYYYTIPNHLRNLHNVWWGYSDLIIKYSHFYNELYYFFLNRLQESHSPLSILFTEIKEKLSILDQQILTIKKDVENLYQIKDCLERLALIESSNFYRLAKIYYNLRDKTFLKKIYPYYRPILTKILIFLEKFSKK